MSYPLLIGRRAILSRENRLLINFTTWIAVLGVALGVAALVVVNAVYDGYIAEIRSRFVSVLSHLSLEGPPGAVPADAGFLEHIAQTPGVVAATPAIQREALLLPRASIGSRRAGAVILGVDLERTQHVTELLSSLTPESHAPGDGEIVLGQALAERLDLHAGDSLVVITDIDTRTGGRPRVDRQTLRVAGTFRSGFYQFDQAFAFTSLDVARDLYGVAPGRADAVELRLANPWADEEVSAALQQRMPRFHVTSWRERHGLFFAGVELTRVALLIILLLLVAVASSNVVGSLIMMVHDRTREIGILRAMGATRRALMAMFLLCGLVISVLGIAVGVGAGRLVCLVLEHGNLIRVPESVYFIDHLPVVIDWAKVGLVAAATGVICLLASVAPALRAARLDPVEALRYE